MEAESPPQPEPHLPKPNGDVFPLAAALKEWAVAIRALREGRQVFLLRKGGILDAGGEFSVEARRVLLFPTYLHEDEQGDALQPCYRQWLHEENGRRPKSDNSIRIEGWAEITDVVEVTNPDALYPLRSQHIHSDSFLRYRIEHDSSRPLYALFLRAYDLPQPVALPLQPEHYGCKSWVTFDSSTLADRGRPAVSDATYNERVRVLRDRLTNSHRSAQPFRETISTNEIS